MTQMVSKVLTVPRDWRLTLAKIDEMARAPARADDIATPRVRVAGWPAQTGRCNRSTQWSGLWSL